MKEEEEFTKKKKKLKLKKRLYFARSLLLVILGLFFIMMGFNYALDINHTYAETLKNVRFGLFSSALLLAGTFLIIAVYQKSKK
jgi:hypothetical protein